MQTVYPHFDVSFGCLVFGFGLFAFQKISLGFDRTVFIIGRMDCTFLRLRGVLIWIFVGITADRAIVPISLDASPFHQLRRVQKCRKMRSCGLYFKKTGIPYSLSY